MLVVIILLSFFVLLPSSSSRELVLYNLFMSKLGSRDVDTSHFNIDLHAAADVLPQQQQGLKEHDKIERLPGQPEVEFEQYGGYITVNWTTGRALYYYFVEATAHQYPNSLPLLLWLNGGPGCSSFGYGAMEEIGPFRVHSDGETLILNEYSWNHAANVLFVESPAGVGFSYSNTSSDMENVGDRRTAIDNYVFLLNWLERFPEYKDRDFYISGESYAGHYAPQLAHTILYHNRNSNPNTTDINLKGIIIGNPTINDETDARGMYQYYESHALISEETLTRILTNCDFRDNDIGMSTECLIGILECKGNIGALDIYNIYAPTCSNSNSTLSNTWPMNIDPCIDEYVHKYLNRPDVQEALHANVTKISYDWQGCSKVIGKWRDSPSTVIPLLDELIDNGLRVWVYSGDIDGRIPISSTKLSIQLIKPTPITPWLPWFLDGDHQVGGYTQIYEGNLTFATVRGAGHQVPSYQPAPALFLINHFLIGKNLTTSFNSTLPN